MDENKFVPIKELIRSVSAHLDGLAAEVHAIEHAIGDTPSQDFLAEGTYIQRLQRLDFVRQSLEDLALLNLFISEHCSGELNEAKGKRLNLAATQALLTRHRVEPPPVTAEHCIGDVDLF